MNLSETIVLETYLETHYGSKAKQSKMTNYCCLLPKKGMDYINLEKRFV